MHHHVGPRPARRVLASLPALTLAAALTGCASDDPDPTARPSPTPSSLASDPSTPAEETSPTPTVTPANGPRLIVPDASFRAPRGWQKMTGAISSSFFAIDVSSGSSVGIDDLHTGETTTTLDELAESVLSRTTGGPKPTRLPDTSLDGVEVYHVTGTVDRYRTFVEYGAIYRGSAVHLRFALSKETPADERREIIDSVLATFRWK